VAAGLWWNTLSTRWEDWEAVRVVPDAQSKTKTRLEKVNVVWIRRRKQAVRAFLAIILGAALYRTWPSVGTLARRLSVDGREALGKVLY
jgi:hypothetical protein